MGNFLSRHYENFDMILKMIWLNEKRLLVVDKLGSVRIFEGDKCIHVNL